MGQWHVPPGQEIQLPPGTEEMRGGLGYWVWYNPVLNRSYYITGYPAAGYDVIEYVGPLCSTCWERYRRYRQYGT